MTGKGRPGDTTPGSSEAPNYFEYPGAHHAEEEVRYEEEARHQEACHEEEGREGGGEGGQDHEGREIREGPEEPQRAEDRDGSRHASAVQRLR
jgi:hypothetical protein